MQIWVLGTLELSHEGRPVEVSGAVPRRLLALLAARPGRLVATERLVEVLDPDDPPEALAAAGAPLRRALPSPDLVVGGQGGWRLAVEAEDVDAVVLERALEDGTRDLLEGRLDQAAERLAEALRLWRGTPYGEFAGWSCLEAESARLVGVRLAALERRLCAALARPRVAPPVAELEALVRWHPGHEPFWVLLMLAQYRIGRVADALAT